MGRMVAAVWHASFSIAAGVLYFFFVLPRWPELMGVTAHTLGTALRVVAGALIGLAALPVVFTRLPVRKHGTPQLAWTLRTLSVVAHVLAGVLIIGTAIREIWLSLDTAGQWQLGSYAAAAAVAALGCFGVYLSFVAELPAPPRKPIKPKAPKRYETVAPTVEADEPLAAAEDRAPTGEELAAARGLRNRRPTGQSSRRRRSPREVAADDTTTFGLRGTLGCWGPASAPECFAAWAPDLGSTR
jgi:hypothetical protein